MSKIALYHRSDSDGLMCGALLERNGYKVYGYQYGETPPVPVEDIDVIADVSLPDDLMLRFKGVWIDHHEPVYKRLKDQLKCGIVYDPNEAACMGVFRFCYGPHYRVPRNVLEVSRYDIWDHHRHTYNHQLGWALLTQLKLPNMDDVFSAEVAQQCIANGRIINKYQRMQDEIVVRSGWYQAGMFGYNAWVVNAMVRGKMSDCVNRQVIGAKRWPDCGIDMLVGYVDRADGSRLYSLRAVGPNCPHLGELATQFGGGGHAGAAGFKSTFDKTIKD